MIAQQTVRGSCLRSSTARLAAKAPLRPLNSRRSAVVTRAGMDTNIFVNLVASTACGAMAAAVTLVTAEDTDKEVRTLAATTTRKCVHHAALAEHCKFLMHQEDQSSRHMPKCTIHEGVLSRNTCIKIARSSYELSIRRHRKCIYASSMPVARSSPADSCRAVVTHVGFPA